MADTRETYTTGGGDPAPPRGGSTMRDMDRMLDETLSSATTGSLGATGDADADDADFVYPGDDRDRAVAADDPDIARAGIEETRARMSETIDDIEDALLRKKESIQDRLNVFGPVKERPLPSVGIAFGAGLVVGLLTGGDEEDEKDEKDEDHGRRASHAPRTEDEEFWARRASDWESRARRLLDLAKRQEVELSELRGRQEMASTTAGAALGAAGAASASHSVPLSDTYEVTLEGDDSEGRWQRVSSPLRSVGDTVVEGLTSFLARATRELSGTQHR